MNNKSSTQITVTLSVSECNGYMKSIWYANNKMLAEVLPESTNDISLTFNVELPIIITVTISGKDSNNDTVVDVNGNIIKDKYLKIKGMSLGRHPIPEYIVHNMCKFITNDGVETNTSFFGFNGDATIEFNEEDPILWHFKHNHYKVS